MLIWYPVSLLVCRGTDIVDVSIRLRGYIKLSTTAIRRRHGGKSAYDSVLESSASSESLGTYLASGDDSGADALTCCAKDTLLVTIQATPPPR